MMELETLSEV
jgi:hypothetical protein